MYLVLLPLHSDEFECHSDKRKCENGKCIEVAYEERFVCECNAGFSRNDSLNETNCKNGKILNSYRLYDYKRETQNTLCNIGYEGST